MKEITATGRKLPFSPGFIAKNPHFFGGGPVEIRQTEKPAVPTARPAAAPQKLNKLETARVALLETEQRHGRISNLKVQSITLRLGYDLRYTPDATYTEGGQLVAEEIKGPFEREDARVKRIAAASQFPFILFRLVKRDKSGAWNVTTIRQ